MGYPHDYGTPHTINAISEENFLRRWRKARWISGLELGTTATNSWTSAAKDHEHVEVVMFVLRLYAIDCFKGLFFGEFSRMLTASPTLIILKKWRHVWMDLYPISLDIGRSRSP